MDGQPTLDLELDRLDAIALEELAAIDARARELGLMPPEVWPEPPEPTDWLGLEELEPRDVARLYDQPPEEALPDSVRIKRELLGWVPELPLKEVKVYCAPRIDAPERPCCDDPRLVVHSSRDREVRDRRIHNAPTTLVVEWTRYRCKTCRKFSAAPLPDIHDHHHITRRLYKGHRARVRETAVRGGFQPSVRGQVFSRARFSRIPGANAQRLSRRFT